MAQRPALGCAPAVTISAAPDTVADLTGTELHPERTGASFAERLDTLRERIEPAETIHLWIELRADMLLRGYFPFDTYGMGHCLQPHNLCIDGGCADTDSLVPMSAIGEERFFTELFLNGSLALALSISRYRRGTGAENHANSVLVSSVWEDLHRRLRKRLAQGERCDPRLERVVKSTGLLERLERLLGNILLGGVPPRGEIGV
jgi:hypothetical protein